MPFAPVTLRSLAAQCFEGWRDEHECSRYMTMCYSVTPELKRTCPAIVHVDDTARPQVVDERDGLYFRIVERYHAATGLLALVNTSFNAHGEPIVGTALDAWKGFFEQDCCDVLALYPYLVHKKGAPRKRSAEDAQLSG